MSDAKSIKRKVIVSIMVTAVTGLLVMVAAFMSYDLATFRRDMAKRLTTQGHIVVANLDVAMAFHNEKDAENVLKSISVEPHIVAAALYDAQGRLFIKYPNQISLSELPLAPGKDGTQFGNNRLTLFQPIFHDGERLGTLYLQSDVTAFLERLEVYGGISLVIMLGSALVVFWFSHVMQKRIADPIIALAETARKVSEFQDYSLRAEKLSADELGQLSKAFNNMLSRIQTSDSALRTSEAQFRFVTDQAPVMLAHVDRDYRYRFVNKPYAERFGCQPPQVIGKIAVEVVGAEVFEKARPYLERVLAGHSVQYELEIPGAGVESRWSHVEYTPERNSAGQVVGLVAVHTDITLRRRHEVELRRLMKERDEQASLFDATLSSISDLAYTFDLEGNWIYANKPLLELWGKSLEDIVGKSSLDLGYPTDLAERLKRQVQEVVETGKPVTGETWFKNHEGLDDYHEYIFSPVLNSDGEVVAVCGTTRLTTERRRAEAAARQLAAIVESSEDAIISKNLDGIISTWNRGAEQLFGYTAAEAIGRPISMLIPEDQANEEPKILERISRGERIEQYETVRRRKDSSLVEVSLMISPMRDGSGQVVGASKIARNISRQKKTERELEKAHHEAVAASRAKDDFLAALSHELRTPLNPVLLAASDAAANPELPVEQRAVFETIRRNVELEARLIDDLLDLTRITRGKLSLDVKTLDVHGVLREAAETVRADAKAKQIELVFDLRAEPAFVSGDAVRLQQVFWNVLKNAVKFTPVGGKIHVETTCEKHEIVIKVTDTGIGIKADDLNRIFDAFSQGNHGAGGSHQFGGLGLGLAISRMLVQLHAGSIHAESAGPGTGAVFLIRLPLKPMGKQAGLPAAPKDSPTPATPLSPVNENRPRKRILLVEDHEPTRTILAQLLTRRHFEVVPAGSMAEARGQVTAHQGEFDLVISDIGLPDGQGYELMAELRDQHGLRGIALTGYGMEEDVTRSKLAGFVTHLTKPVRVESLEKALALLLSEES